MTSPISHTHPFLPWYNWAAIDFLNSINLANKTIFEYGCGNSTLYYASRAAIIHGSELKQQWLDFVNQNAMPHYQIHITLITNPAYFASSITSSTTKYDLIAIDSLNRIQCLHHAINHIKDNGMILLDNAERPNLSQAIHIMSNAGFSYIDFQGLGPNRDIPSISRFFKKP